MHLDRGSDDTSRDLIESVFFFQSSATSARSAVKRCYG
jgi:hypothetical protein